jgi:hypothetical protein
MRFKNYDSTSLSKLRYDTTPLFNLKEELNELKSKTAKLEAVISEIESSPRREIDMADSHTGDPAFIAKSTLLRGKRGERRWRVRESIYCSLERCPNCPHGDYFYDYFRNKRKGTLTVKLVGGGGAVFKIEDLEAMASDRKPFFDEFGEFRPDC